MTEKELINAVCEGKQQAFKQLVLLHQELIVNTCYTFLKNKEDAEDTAQEVFIEVF